MEKESSSSQLKALLLGPILCLLGALSSTNMLHLMNRLISGSNSIVQGVSLSSASVLLGLGGLITVRDLYVLLMNYVSRKLGEISRELDNLSLHEVLSDLAPVMQLVGFYCLPMNDRQRRYLIQSYAGQEESNLVLQPGRWRDLVGFCTTPTRHTEQQQQQAGLARTVDTSIGSTQEDDEEEGEFEWSSSSLPPATASAQDHTQRVDNREILLSNELTMMNQEKEDKKNTNSNDGGLYLKTLGTASAVFLISRATGIRKRKITLGLLGYKIFTYWYQMNKRRSQN